VGNRGCGLLRQWNHRGAGAAPPCGSAEKGNDALVPLDVNPTPRFRSGGKEVIAMDPRSGGPDAIW
jgi:hypothetical protein